MIELKDNGKNVMDTKDVVRRTNLLLDNFKIKLDVLLKVMIMALSILSVQSCKSRSDIKQKERGKQERTIELESKDSANVTSVNKDSSLIVIEGVSGVEIIERLGTTEKGLFESTINLDLSKETIIQIDSLTSGSSTYYGVNLSKTANDQTLKKSSLTKTTEIKGFSESNSDNTLSSVELSGSLNELTENQQSSIVDRTDSVVTNRKWLVEKGQSLLSSLWFLVKKLYWLIIPLLVYFFFRRKISKFIS